MRVARLLYQNANGDSWKLVRDEAWVVSITHTPGGAEGGLSRRIEIGTFLTRSDGSPESQALLNLIATLIDEDVRPTEEPSANHPAPEP